MPENTKIQRIKIGTVTHEIEDATAVHDVKTINEVSLVGSGNIDLPDTPITSTEITNLFEGSAS